MKFDAALPPIQLKDVPAIAKSAQEIGFDALWTQETQHDPFLPCTLIAEHSEARESAPEISLGTPTETGRRARERSRLHPCDSGALGEGAGLPSHSLARNQT